MPKSPIVVLTREKVDNLRFARRLASKRVRVLSYPCIAVRLIPESEWRIDGGGRPDDFRVVVFTSKRGVLGARNLSRVLADPHKLIGVVGKSTAAALEQHFGRKAEVLGSPATGEGLAAALAPLLAPGEVVLYLCGNNTRGGFQHAMKKRGFGISELVVYENLAPERRPLSVDCPALVVFASPSAAERFFTINTERFGRDHYLAIGPTTEDHLRKMGLTNVSRASEPSDEGLADKIEDILKRLELSP